MTTADDLPVDPAGDPLVVDSPAAVLALVEVLGGDRSRQARPLRDATCQSFPIWDLGRSVANRLAAADDDELDAVATEWLERAEGIDADAHTVGELLEEVRTALDRADGGARVFVLLEERAF